MCWLTGRLAVHVTIAALTAHMILGCCWHHAHACGATCPAEHGALAHALAAAAPHADDACAAAGHDRHACQGLACVFLATAAQRDCVSSRALVSCSGVPALGDCHASPVAAAGRGAALSRHTGPPPGVPLYLLIQVLRI